MKYYLLFRRLVYTAWLKFVNIPLNNKRFSCLKRYRNTHKGDRVFIIATGPSLTAADLDLLKNEYTFSMNSVYKMFDKTDWRPSFYCVADGAVFKKIQTEIDSQPLKECFVKDEIPWQNCKVNRLPVIPNLCNTELLRASFPSLALKSYTSSDISKGIYMGNSVVHVITQICFYMGFSKIYYIGADCSNFKSHAADCDHNIKLSRSEDNLAMGIKADYEADYEYGKKHGIQMYNVTRGGALEVFPRLSLEDVIK